MKIKILLGKGMLHIISLWLMKYVTLTAFAYGTNTGLVKEGVGSLNRYPYTTSKQFQVKKYIYINLHKLYRSLRERYIGLCF